MPFTKWKSLNSAFEIQDTPFRQWEYKYSLFLHVYFNEEGASDAALLAAMMGGFAVPMTGLASKTVSQDWTLQVKQKNAVVFKQDVHLEYYFVALELSYGFGVTTTLFTWYLNDTATETDITFPDPPPDIIGDPRGTSIPGGGSDYTSNYYTVLVDWYSPIFNLSIANGDKINIPFHNAGGPYVTKYANIQTRGIQGASISIVHSTKQGLTFLLDSSNGSARLRRLYWSQLSDVDAVQVQPDDDEAPITAGSLLPVSSGMKEKILLLPGETVTVVQEDRGDIRYWESLNEGIYKDETGWMSMATLENHRLLGATAAKDKSGVMLLLKDSDGRIVSSRARWDTDEDDKGTITFSTPVPVTLNGEGFPSIADELHYLEDLGDSILLGIRSDRDTLFYVSRDDMETFTDT